MSRPMIHGRENVLTRSEISIENIRSLEFMDISLGVALRRVVLWTLRPIHTRD